MITVWFSRMILVDSLCRWSRRRSVIRACTRATVTRALARFADPFCFFARRRCASASRARSRRSCPGLVTFSPASGSHQPGDARVDPHRRGGRRQRPGPGTRPGSKCATGPPRPGDTVTVDGSAPSGSGLDHTIASGADIFASQTCPSRYRNPDVVNVADARDLRLDLNAGYLARLAQKFT